VKGMRVGAAALALVLVVAGCSKQPRSLLGPGSGTPGKQPLPGSASYRLSFRIDPDTVNLAFGTRQALQAIASSSSPSNSVDTVASRVYRWSGDPKWVYLDSAVTRRPAASMVLIGPADMRTQSTSVRLFVVDTLFITTRRDSIVPGSSPPRDTVYVFHSTRLDTVAAARTGVGFVRPARPNVAPVALISPDSVNILFGAGFPARAQAKTATGADTSSASWLYAWQADPNLIQFDVSGRRGDPTNIVVLLGTSVTAISSTDVTCSVIRDVNVYSVVGGVITAQPSTMDTLAVGTMAVGFQRASPGRDIAGDFWIYHITKSLGGSIYASTDSALAQFVNNDANHSLLRAGAVGLSGIPLLERHAITGQYYSGPVLFRVGVGAELTTTGPDRDPKSQVPKCQVDVPGLPNELVLTLPNNRTPVSRSVDLQLQWSGGLSDTLLYPNDPTVLLQDPIYCSPSGTQDTLCVPVRLTIQLTDVAGHTFQIQTRDSGLFTMSWTQLTPLVPGLINVVLTRELLYPAVIIPSGSLRVLVSGHLIEENHSSFFLQ